MDLEGYNSWKIASKSTGLVQPGGSACLNPKMKGIRGSLPARLSQPVDPGEVGGFPLRLLFTVPLKTPFKFSFNVGFKVPFKRPLQNPLKIPFKVVFIKYRTLSFS